MILQRWRTNIECINTSCLIPIETNVAISQEMTDSQLLQDNRVPLCNFALLLRRFERDYHSIFFFDRNPCGPHSCVALQSCIIKLGTAVKLVVAALDELHPMIECTIPKSTKQYLRARGRFGSSRVRH